MCETVALEKAGGGGDDAVGRLGYVNPIVKGEQTQKETLARVMQVDGERVKVVYMERCMAIGKERVNLNATDENVMNNPAIQMKPVIIVPSKIKYQDIGCPNVVNNPALVGLPPHDPGGVRACLVPTVPS